MPPFLSPASLPWGEATPLASIHVLVQAPADAREALPVAAALPELLRQVLVYVGEPRTAALVLDLAAELVDAVTVDRLRFRKAPSVAAVLGITVGAAPPPPSSTDEPASTPAGARPRGGAVDAREPGRYPAGLGRGAITDPANPEDAP